MSVDNLYYIVYTYFGPLCVVVVVIIIIIIIIIIKWCFVQKLSRFFITK
jgi:hypothetical protein